MGDIALVPEVPFEAYEIVDVWTEDLSGNRKTVFVLGETVIFKTIVKNTGNIVGTPQPFQLWLFVPYFGNVDMGSGLLRAMDPGEEIDWLGLGFRPDTVYSGYSCTLDFNDGLSKTAYFDIV